MISWKSYIDDGSPTFVQSDDDMQIVCAPGDRGRWLGSYLEPLKAGQELTLLAQARSASPIDNPATILVIFWANEPGLVFHSSLFVGETAGSMPDFKQFVYKFSVPAGVKSLRIDLRAWSGAGSFIFKDVRITEAESPPPPPPPPPTGHQLSIDLDLETIIWRITASKESVTALRIAKE